MVGLLSEVSTVHVERSMRLVVLAFLFFGIVGCQSSSNPETSTIHGQVFVRTQGGSSVELGLVDVHAIPADSVEDHLQKIKQSRDSILKESRDTLASYIDSVDKEIYTNDGLTPDYSDSERELKRELEDEVSEYVNVLKPDFYFVGLPSAVDTFQTGSRGEYQLEVPHGVEHYVSARTTRLVGDETERFHWFVKTNPTSDSTRVLLTNRNSGYLFDNRYAISYGSAERAIDDIVDAAANDARDLEIGEEKTSDWARALRLAAERPSAIRATYDL